MKYLKAKIIYSIQLYRILRVKYLLNILIYLFSASAPPTISKISLVIAA